MKTLQTALRLTAVVGTLVFGWTHAVATLAPGAAAEILDLQGSGDQRPAGVAEWRVARPKQTLSAGDFVRTRESARMALLFADDTQIRLNQNTVLQVKGVANAATPVTQLLLNAGRAWAQTKRADGSRLTLETPAAVAAIRGTDWDVEVAPDGRTVLTVLSGQIEFSNAQGGVTLERNEAAVAEIGKAPVKLMLSNPRDRVQWVHALRLDVDADLATDESIPAQAQPAVAALRAGRTTQAASLWVDLRPTLKGGWSAVLQAAVLAKLGNAIEALRALMDARPAELPVAGWMLAGDLLLYQGEPASAATQLRRGLLQHPGHPALTARLAHAYVLDNQLDKATAVLGSPTASTDVDLLLARAELAHRRGERNATLDAYREATQRAPQDARGWVGLGGAYTELEDSTPARNALNQARQLAPQYPGLQGEIGTLESMVDQFAVAEDAFASALDHNAADYVALSGLGLLRLKQGKPLEALDAFLRAGVMEPRYARAKTWSAVAYYQLGRASDAVQTLQQAIALDDKDPMPHMLLAQIHTDRMEAGAAVDAARAALQRMPYLKSLNQLANDQRGSANLGAALAFFGMEEWALDLAQQSFNPYFGSSHLFLADRYSGEFNKNSELFQGFLTDPLAFGASQTASSLLQQAGNHGALEWQSDRQDYNLSSPSFTLNGMDNRNAPIAWYVKAQGVQGQHFPIQMAVANVPPMQDPTGDMNVRGHVLTLGLGLKPSEHLNVFAYANEFKAMLRGTNHFDASLGMGLAAFATNIDMLQRQLALGASYRWSPTESTWVKVGRNLENDLYLNYPLVMRVANLVGQLSASLDPQKDFSDFALRHSLDLPSGARLSGVLEHVSEHQFVENVSFGIAGGYRSTGEFVSGALLVGGTNTINRRYTAFGLHWQQAAADWQWEAGLNEQIQRNDVVGHNITDGSFTLLNQNTMVVRNTLEHTLSPRLGLVLKQGSSTVRLAYQDWVRPPSTSTLASVETAGLPLDDVLVEAGGRLRRLGARWSREQNGNRFLWAQADLLHIENPGNLGVDLRTPVLPFLQDMRNTQIINLSSLDMQEDIPSVQSGRVRRVLLGLNQLLTPQWSAYAKYQWLSGRNTITSGYTGAVTLDDGAIAFMPRHTLALGSTWTSPQHWYVSGRLLYRSSRTVDAENVTLRHAGWVADLALYRESADKRWIVGMGALNLFAPLTSGVAERFALQARYRF